MSRAIVIYKDATSSPPNLHLGVLEFWPKQTQGSRYTNIFSRGERETIGFTKSAGPGYSSWNGSEVKECRSFFWHSNCTGLHPYNPGCRVFDPRSLDSFFLFLGLLFANSWEACEKEYEKNWIPIASVWGTLTLRSAPRKGKSRDMSQGRRLRSSELDGGELAPWYGITLNGQNFGEPTPAE